MANQQTFSDLISGAVAERMTPEVVEPMILERVDKLITTAIDDALRNYSDTGKLIKEAVSGALRVGGLDLPAYGDTVHSILKSQIEANVSELVAGRLQEDMAELLQLAPKTIKLSEIVEQMRTERHGDEPGEKCTRIVERSEYGSVHVYLDDFEAGLSKHRCDVSIFVGKDGLISSAGVGSRGLKDRASIGGRYGLEQRIRSFYACGTLIEIDEEDVDVGSWDC